MNGWIRAVAGGLATLVTLAIVGALGVWAQQGEIKKDVTANGKKAGVCCEKAEKNQNDITIVATEWRIFQIQYERDQRQAADDRKAILDAVKR